MGAHERAARGGPLQLLLLLLPLLLSLPPSARADRCCCDDHLMSSSCCRSGPDLIQCSGCADYLDEEYLTIPAKCDGGNSSSISSYCVCNGASPNMFVLAAQIGLGAALTLAVLTLFTTLWRGCSSRCVGSSRRGRRGGRRRGRGLARSGALRRGRAASLDSLGRQLRDRTPPPRYSQLPPAPSELDKPPSYRTLQRDVAPNPTAESHQTGPAPDPTRPLPSEGALPADPPPYEAIFTISLRVALAETGAATGPAGDPPETGPVHWTVGGDEPAEAAYCNGAFDAEEASPATAAGGIEACRPAAASKVSFVCETTHM